MGEDSPLAGARPGSHGVSRGRIGGRGLYGIHMRVVLPLPPNRGNSRWHWRTEKRKKDDYMLRCCVTAKLYDCSPEDMATPLEKARITASLYVWSMMDTDNLMARLKWPVDWLVSEGYVADDNPNVLEWAGLPTQQVDRKNQRVEFVLESV